MIRRIRSDQQHFCNSRILELAEKDKKMDSFKRRRRRLTPSSCVMLMVVWTISTLTLGTIIQPSTAFVAPSSHRPVLRNTKATTRYTHQSSSSLTSAQTSNDERFDNTSSSSNENTSPYIRPTLSYQNHDSAPATKVTNQQNKIRNSLLSLIMATLLATTILPFNAYAGFGPSSGATTSPPPGLKSPQSIIMSVPTQQSLRDEYYNSLLNGQTKSGKKLKSIIGSTIDERRLQEFSQQLDAIIESLRERNIEGDGRPIDTTGSGGSGSLTYDEATANQEFDTLEEKLQKQQEELEKAKLLQYQIQERENLLARLERQPYYFNYFAAFIGSVASTLVMHPIDTIKTRMQLQKPVNNNGNDTVQIEDNTTMGLSEMYDHNHYGYHNNSEAWSKDGPTTTAAVADPVLKVSTNINHHDHDHHHEHQEVLTSLTSSIDKSTSLFNNKTIHDILSLYEGLTGNLWKEGPPSAVYLGVYETVKYSLAPTVSSNYLLWVYLLAGAAGETVGSVIRAPAEAVKSLVQSRATDTALDAVKRVLGTPEGRQNVLRAWSASISRDVPFGAIQLATFELIKVYILNNPNIDIDSSTLATEAIIGAFAGGFGSFLTNPTDVITTRIITQSTGTEGEKEIVETKPLNAIEMGKKIYEEEGLSAFFNGWQARVGYWAPAISIFLTVYCSVRQLAIKWDWWP